MNGFKGGLILAYMGFLAYMSLGRGYPPTLERALARGSTLLHLVGYGLLAILLIWVLPRGNRTRPWLGVAVAFSYGGLLEVLQFLAPGRTPSVLDLGINLVGAVVGGTCFWGSGFVWQRWIRRVAVPGKLTRER